MDIKAIIPARQIDITVNGLHQWDYGRKLVIISEELPAMVEVHFACDGMQTAIVRACETVGGVAEVTIPNTCLEQIAPLKAWVYAIGENSGETIATITMPIASRVRPQACATPPEEISDKYTEAVAAMNKAVDKVANGEVVVPRARVADKAVTDNDGNIINTCYGNFSRELVATDLLGVAGWYYFQVTFNSDTTRYGSFIYWDGYNGMSILLDASPGATDTSATTSATVHKLIISNMGLLTVKRWQSLEPYYVDVTKNVTIEYTRIL